MQGIGLSTYTIAGASLAVSGKLSSLCLIMELDIQRAGSQHGKVMSRMEPTNNSSNPMHEKRLKPEPILVISDSGNMGIHPKEARPCVTELNMHTWLRHQRNGRIIQGKVE